MKIVVCDNLNKGRFLLEKIKGIRGVKAADRYSVLSPIQEKFCVEYLVDMNGTKAALRAGYSEKGAATQSVRLLKNAYICSRIKILLDESLARTKINADKVLTELLKLATSDVRKLFDENGKMKPIHELDDDIAPAISSIEIDEIWEGLGRDRVQVGETKKVKFWDKPKALELLGKHLALFVDRVDSTNDVKNTIVIETEDQNL